VTKKNYQHLSFDQALEKLRHYCAYQDRCHSEVRTKLLDLQIYGDDLEEIIGELIQENFLNEERFAQSYVRGKFNLKKWGRIKILQGLKLKKVSAYCIKKGMQEIDEEDYKKTLSTILEKKLELLDSSLNSFIKYKKLMQYAMGRGYEIPLIKKCLAQLDLD